MVSSACRGSYTNATHQRKLLIDPQKDYCSPLHVETSVEYDLPAHIYPPKGAGPILMINPSYLRRPRIQQTSSNHSNIVNSSRSLNSLQLPPIPISNTRNVLNPRKAMCSCGNISCTVNSVKSLNMNRNSATNRTMSLRESDLYSARSASVIQHPKSSMSITSVEEQNKIDHSRLEQSRLEQLSRLEQSRLEHSKLEQNRQQIQQQNLWTRCQNICCNPRAASMAPVSEFATPGLPPSLLARTPTRGTSGSSPKLRSTGGRSRRGINLASTVHLPEYLGTSRPSRISIASAAHAHPRPRAMSTSGALAAAPAPQMAHQTMGVSLTTSLDLARTNISRSVYGSQSNPQQSQQQNQLNTAALLSTVGLSRDSGCSIGDASMNSNTSTGIDWSSDWSRSLVDSGFCTPVDFTNNDDSLLGLSGDIPSMASSMSNLSGSNSNLFPSNNGSSLLNNSAAIISGNNYNSTFVNSTNSTMNNTPYTSSLSSSSHNYNNKDIQISWKDHLSSTSSTGLSSSASLHPPSFLAPPHPHYLPHWNLVY